MHDVIFKFEILPFGLKRIDFERARSARVVKMYVNFEKYIEEEENKRKSIKFGGKLLVKCNVATSV